VHYKTDGKIKNIEDNEFSIPDRARNSTTLYKKNEKNGKK
jgi:hypothetical protein